MWSHVLCRVLSAIGWKRQGQQLALPPAEDLPPTPIALARAMGLAPPAEPQPTAGPWRPLPGQVIELGDSGFQIQLDLRQARYPYVLRSPEGAVIGYGSDLPGLKTLGERFAAERQEFAFRGASR